MEDGNNYRESDFWINVHELIPGLFNEWKISYQGIKSTSEKYTDPKSALEL